MIMSSDNTLIKIIMLLNGGGCAADANDYYQQQQHNQQYQGASVQREGNNPAMSNQNQRYEEVKDSGQQENRESQPHHNFNSGQLYERDRPLQDKGNSTQGIQFMIGSGRDADEGGPHMKPYTGRGVFMEGGASAFPSERMLSESGMKRQKRCDLYVPESHYIASNPLLQDKGNKRKRRKRQHLQTSPQRPKVSNENGGGGVGGQHGSPNEISFLQRNDDPNSQHQIKVDLESDESIQDGNGEDDSEEDEEDDFYDYGLQFGQNQLLSKENQIKYGDPIYNIIRKKLSRPAMLNEQIELWPMQKPYQRQIDYKQLESEEFAFMSYVSNHIRDSQRVNPGLGQLFPSRSRLVQHRQSSIGTQKSNLSQHFLGGALKNSALGNGNSNNDGSGIQQSSGHPQYQAGGNPLINPRLANTNQIMRDPGAQPLMILEKGNKNVTVVIKANRQRDQFLGEIIVEKSESVTPAHPITGSKSLTKGEGHADSKEDERSSMNKPKIDSNFLQNPNSSNILAVDESHSHLIFVGEGGDGGSNSNNMKDPIITQQNSAQRSKRHFRNLLGRSEIGLDLKNQLSLDYEDFYDDGGLILDKIENMAAQNTESVIQFRRMDNNDANSLECNRGGIGGAERPEFDGFETPTSSFRKRMNSKNYFEDTGANLIKPEMSAINNDDLIIPVLNGTMENNNENVPEPFMQANRMASVLPVEIHSSNMANVENDDLDFHQLESTVTKSLLAQKINELNYDRKSLYLFSLDNRLRKKIIQLVDSRFFEYFMVIIILMNSLSLALFDYNDRDSQGRFNQLLDEANIGFTTMFIIEASMKIVAKGLIMHPDSFLRSGWNIIDSAVVISGILELVFGSVKLKALRIFRVFRPLKSINVVPSMKKLIQALIHSLPDFANVGTFLVYVFILFATMGLHQYNGVFYNICRINDRPETNASWVFLEEPQYQRVCSQTGLGGYTCPNGYYCGNHDDYQYYNFSSDKVLEREYLNYGITNFDNIGSSLLSVFQIINSDTWNQQLINFMDVDIPLFGAFYCLMMIIVGQFFLMNLILAVIIFAFIKTQKKELEIEINELHGEEKDPLAMSIISSAHHMSYAGEQDLNNNGDESFRSETGGGHYNGRKRGSFYRKGKKRGDELNGDDHNDRDHDSSSRLDGHKDRQLSKHPTRSQSRLMNTKKSLRSQKSKMMIRPQSKEFLMTSSGGFKMMGGGVGAGHMHHNGTHGKRKKKEEGKISDFLRPQFQRRKIVNMLLKAKGETDQGVKLDSNLESQASRISNALNESAMVENEEVHDSGTFTHTASMMHLGQPKFLRNHSRRKMPDFPADESGFDQINDSSIMQAPHSAIMVSEKIGKLIQKSALPPKPEIQIEFVPDSEDRIREASIGLAIEEVEEEKEGSRSDTPILERKNMYTPKSHANSHMQAAMAQGVKSNRSSSISGKDKLKPSQIEVKKEKKSAGESIRKNLYKIGSGLSNFEESNPNSGSSSNNARGTVLLGDTFGDVAIRRNSKMLQLPQSKMDKKDAPASLDKQGSQVMVYGMSKNSIKFKRAFRRFIRKKIDQEYEQKFKKMLKEAKEAFQGGQNDKIVQQTNMRELAGLKVGLEYIRQQRENMKKRSALDEIEERTQSRRLYEVAFNVQESSYFQGFMALAIVINTVVLSLDKYPVNIQLIGILEKINIAFILIFSIEMVIKMVAVGVKNYFVGSAFNTFDCLIVVASLIDLVLSNIIVQSQDSGSVITALRGFRLLRIFKLAKSWKHFELLLETLGRTLTDIATFTVLLFIFIFTFTLFGLEVFAYRAKLNLALGVVDPNGVSPEFNFDTFLNSFTTVFIVLTNEAMSDIYYNHYRTVGPTASTAFFISLVIIGQKILLNLFLAILLENFDEGALKQDMHDEAEKTIRLNELSFINRVKAQIKLFFDTGFLKMEKFCRRGKNYADDIDEATRVKMLKGLQIFAKAGSKKGALNDNVSQILIRQQAGLPVLEGKSFNLFEVDNKFRQLVFKIVDHKLFDYAIMCVIVLSSIQLALDNPINDPESNIKKSLYWIDLGTTIIFLFEAVMKNISFGFIFNGKSSYMRQKWNLVDFVIILFSLLSLTPLSDNLRSFKIFRVLRILRLITRNEELKVAVRALFLAIPNVANVTIIMILFFLIFGIIAVSYFKGKLFYCASSIDGSTVGSKWDCLNFGGEWLNQVYNFDNVYNALMTLFVMSTIAGWADIMMLCATSTDVDYVQGTEASAIWIFYFIIFIIVGAFFFLNLFVGVVISTFNSEHEKLGGNNLLTEKQKEWIELRLLVLRSAPQKKLAEPIENWRKPFFQISHNKYFERFVYICIVANTLVLLVKWYEQPALADKISESINYVFTAIFLIEAILKLVGIGPRVYFTEGGWNIFDTIIIFGSFLSIFISANSSLQIRGALSILRSFRILRLLRLIKRGKSLQMIFNTFVITLHSLANIGALLLLFIFMYSILGMIFFGEVMRTGIMNDYINFESFQTSFITLFIVATGDSWNDIMEAFSMEFHPTSQCIANPDYSDYQNNGYQNMGCGSQNLSFLYFVSYTFVVNLVFLKIFIAIILQGYEDTQTQDGRLFNHDMNDKFRETWTEFDPNATTFIPLYALRDFLFQLGAPLGFDESFRDRKLLQDQFIASLELPTYQNFSSYHFLDILDALSFRLMVLDHIQKHNNEEQIAKLKTEDRQLPPSAQLTINKEHEREIKDQLQKEINKLIFQKEAEHITAVKEVSDKETRRLKAKIMNRDQNGLTSSHHMAAEATVRKFRAFIKKRRGEQSSSDTSSLKTESMGEHASSHHSQMTRPSLKQQFLVRSSDPNNIDLEQLNGGNIISSNNGRYGLDSSGLRSNKLPLHQVLNGMGSSDDRDSLVAGQNQQPNNYKRQHNPNSVIANYNNKQQQKAANDSSTSGGGLLNNDRFEFTGYKCEQVQRRRRRLSIAGRRFSYDTRHRGGVGGGGSGMGQLKIMSDIRNQDQVLNKRNMAMTGPKEHCRSGVEDGNCQRSGEENRGATRGGIPVNVEERQVATVVVVDQGAKQQIGGTGPSQDFSLHFKGGKQIGPSANTLGALAQESDQQPSNSSGNNNDDMNQAIMDPANNNSNNSGGSQISKPSPKTTAQNAKSGFSRQKTIAAAASQKSNHNNNSSSSPNKGESRFDNYSSNNQRQDGGGYGGGEDSEADSQYHEQRDDQVDQEYQQEDQDEGDDDDDEEESKHDNGHDSNGRESQENDSYRQLI